jgi:hypothetical protein
MGRTEGGMEESLVDDEERRTGAGPRKVEHARRTRRVYISKKLTFRYAEAWHGLKHFIRLALIKTQIRPRSDVTDSSQ